MKGGKKQDPIDVKPLFRNTKSKFYSQKKTKSKDSKFQQRYASENKTGAFWKQKGNQNFKNKQYDTAIECYTKAIEINPGQSQYYSNRSKCYQKKMKFNEALKDAEIACELNQENIKAHYICGCILGELGKSDQTKLKKAENRLKKALRLCATLSTTEYQESISIKMFRLRKIMYFKQQQNMLQSIKLQKQTMKNNLDKYKMPKKDYDLIMHNIQKRQEVLKTEKQIPDYLICKITLMLIQDPVVSEAGFSYQRQALQEYYQAKGPIQPITRKQTSGKIITNHALKIAIEQYLADNPWAFEQQPNQDYHNIIMI